DRSANIKSGAEWFDAFRAQRLEFFSSERDQLVFVFHIRTANVKPRACFATLNREGLIEVLASGSKPTYYVCQRNIYNVIVSAGAANELPSRCHIQMTANLPQTSSKLEGPLVKQFSVFLPNKVGAMLEIVKLLSTRHTHVVALSVSESTDSAI